MNGPKTRKTKNYSLRYYIEKLFTFHSFCEEKDREEMHINTKKNPKFRLHYT